MLLDNTLLDLRTGARVLRKDRGFCLLAVFVLGLGICAVTTQFTVVNAVVLRGFSFPEPDQLASVGFIDPSQPNQNNFGGGIPSSQDYEDLRATQQSFAMMAAFLNGSTVNVTYEGSPQRYTGGYVTEDFFRILGVAPVMGEDFTADDNQQGVERVVIIGHKIWSRDFGADPGIIGKTMRINGRTARIKGVMPEGFQFPVNEELWVPLYNEFPNRARNDPAAIGPAVLGRLKPGVSLDQATVEFTALAQRLAQDYPDTNRALTAAQVQPLIVTFIGPIIRGLMWFMLFLVALVLAIACVNVMNMQFARATMRAKEMAIRGALGATRWRLVRQMLTESLLLAALGAAVGVPAAIGAVRLLWRSVQSLPFPLPYWIRFDIDPLVLGVTVGITGLAAVMSGLVPALVASRTRSAEIMKEGGRGNTSRVVRIITGALVVLQIGATACLLVASLFQVRSIVNQTSLDYGYDEEAFYTARLGLFEGDYPTPQSRLQFFQRTLLELRSTPDFAHAALTGRFRMTFGGFGPYEVDGQTYATDNDRPRGNFENVSDGYFETAGITLLDGREFRDDDTDEKQPVAIVNASFARKHFGNESPVGRRVRVYNPAQAQPWRTVIGVVSDTLMQGPFNQQADNAGFYTPLMGGSIMPQFATILVRPPQGRSAGSLAAALRTAMIKVDSNLPLYFPGTPRQLHDEILGQQRIIAWLFTIFGIVAVLLSAVGLYGVMSFSVSQRIPEIGIRMALGANAGRIRRMVLGEGGLQLAIGIVIGLGFAFALVLVGQAFAANALQNILYGVNLRDPFIYLAVVGVLAATAAISSFVPARRATQVDPLVALRTE